MYISHREHTVPTLKLLSQNVGVYSAIRNCLQLMVDKCYYRQQYGSKNLAIYIRPIWNLFFF